MDTSQLGPRSPQTVLNIVKSHKSSEKLFTQFVEMGKGTEVSFLVNKEGLCVCREILRG
jgi:hypothetical protein